MKMIELTFDFDSSKKVYINLEHIKYIRTIEKDNTDAKTVIAFTDGTKVYAKESIDQLFELLAKVHE